MSDFKAHVDKIVGEDNRHRDHFPDIAEGSVFPVWVRVERINEKV